MMFTVEDFFDLARWRKTWQVLDGQTISPTEWPTEPGSMAH
jgi:hypothetical protein